MICTRTFAWGNKGHEIIAQLVWNIIDSTTKKNVTEYLDGMTIEQASTWMNDVSKDPKYAYMKDWHYVRASLYDWYTGGKSLGPAEKLYSEAKQPNIITELTRVMKELQHIKQLPDSTAKFDLLVMIHLLGDLYQPLNVGYDYNDTLGEIYQMRFFDKLVTTRTLWDSTLIAYDNITAEGCIASRLWQDCYNIDINMERNEQIKWEMKELGKGDVVYWTYIPFSNLQIVYQIFRWNTRSEVLSSEQYASYCKRVIERLLTEAAILISMELKVVVNPQ